MSVKMNDRGRGAGRSAWVLYALVVGVVVGALAGMWRLGAGRWICVDEFEHLHAAWCITPAGGGQVPYRDFFEHHTPLLYYGLAPVLAWLRPEGSFASAWAAVVTCRRIMWVLAGVTLWAVYRLGRGEHSRAAGALAVVLTLLSMKFIDRIVEIRPDVISVPCILGGLGLTLGGIRAAALWTAAPGRPRGELWRYFWAGVLFGLAVLATPKALFALLGFAPAMAGFVLHVARVRVAGRTGWLPALGRAGAIAGAELGGFVLPIAVMMGYLTIRGAAWEFVHHNLVLNAHWKYHFSLAERWEKIGEVVYENPLLAGLGVAGLVATVVRCAGGRWRERGHVVLAVTTVGLIAGIFIIPVAYDEYFLMLIPLLAIYAAGALLDLARHGRAMLHGQFYWTGGAFSAWAVAAVAIVVGTYRPPLVGSGVDLAVWIGAGVAWAVLLRWRMRHAAVGAVVVGMLTFAGPRFGHLFDLSNEATQRSMRYVHEHTRPDEAVMDGWDKITAPFRPHAWRYFFLHREVRPMVVETAWAGLLEDMRSGRFRPAVIVWDRDNQAVPEAVRGWIGEHYEAIGAGELPGQAWAEAPLLRSRAGW